MIGHHAQIVNPAAMAIEARHHCADDIGVAFRDPNRRCAMIQRPREVGARIVPRPREVACRPDRDHRVGVARRGGPQGHGWSLSARSLMKRASRSEEPTSELQSLIRISYAVFCLKKK